MVDLSNIEVATCIRCDAINYKTDSHSHDQHAMMLLPVSSTMTVNDEHYGMRRLLERDYFYYVEAGLPHDTWANRSYQEHIAVYLNRDWQSVDFH
ncbi:MAG: hypothetical protein ABJN75_00060 [Hoeflea sp.]|uniref:hypothetical protein n=1 Tax=Hoeflea sp. TaxID=1940281 RepID=UPI003299A4B2